MKVKRMIVVAVAEPAALWTAGVVFLMKKLTLRSPDLSAGP